VSAKLVGLTEREPEGRDVLGSRKQKIVNTPIRAFANQIARLSGRDPRPALWHDAAFKQADDLLGHYFINVHVRDS
jgi:hypothetical protein